MAALFADAPWLRFNESISPDAPIATAHGVPDGDDEPDTGAKIGPDEDLLPLARRARELGGAEVGLAIRARSRSGDTAVSIAVSTPGSERQVHRVVFLSGPLGRSRAALAVAALLFEVLREAAPEDGSDAIEATAQIDR